MVSVVCGCTTATNHYHCVKAAQPAHRPVIQIVDKALCLKGLLQKDQQECHV